MVGVYEELTKGGWTLEVNGRIVGKESRGQKIDSEKDDLSYNGTELCRF